jgi:phosphopantetheinyl transferase
MARQDRKLADFDAVKIHALALTRAKGTGSFLAKDALRATLAIIDLDRLTPLCRNELISTLLDETEITRINMFKHVKRQQSFTGGRLAAKLALQTHCNSFDPRQARIENGVFDQPLVSAKTGGMNDLGISVSHSEHYAVALVFHRGHPMGIDVDRPSMDDAKLLLPDLTPAVADMLAGLALADQAAASLMWVARESLGKTLTTGMMTPLSIYAPSAIKMQNGFFVVHYKNFSQYQTLLWPGAKGWLGLTLPRETTFNPLSFHWD